LQGVLKKAQQDVLSHRKPVSRAPQMSGGWYHLGTPKTTVYRVEDLVAYWRIQMVQKYRQKTPPLDFAFKYMRTKILEWLRADGHPHCEKVIAYAVKMWEPLKDEFEIEAEYPNMNIIWGFRQVFHKRMQQKENRKWGAHWNGTQETADYSEQVS
jgi:hypothetical protein